LLSSNLDAANVVDKYKIDFVINLKNLLLHKKIKPKVIDDEEFDQNYDNSQRVRKIANSSFVQSYD
jgi:hypothetical protein